jgi:hypothetical protein
MRAQTCGHCLIVFNPVQLDSDGSNVAVEPSGFIRDLPLMEAKSALGGHEPVNISLSLDFIALLAFLTVCDKPTKADIELRAQRSSLRDASPANGVSTTG